VPSDQTSRRCPGRRPTPSPLEGLERLAYNHYWIWHPRVRVLFRRIDAGTWLRYRNPVPLAVVQAQRNWSEIVDDPTCMAEYKTLLDEFDRYMANGSGHWFQRRHGAS
jgi:glucan phosphorylase